VRLALKHKFRVIYHCDFIEGETFDLLEAAKDSIFLAPAIGIIYTTAYEAGAWGITKDIAEHMEMFTMLETCPLPLSLITSDPGATSAWFGSSGCSRTTPSMSAGKHTNCTPTLPPRDGRARSARGAGLAPWRCCSRWPQRRASSCAHRQ